MLHDSFILPPTAIEQIYTSLKETTSLISRAKTFVVVVRAVLRAVDHVPTCRVEHLLFRLAHGLFLVLCGGEDNAAAAGAVVEAARDVVGPLLDSFTNSRLGKCVRIWTGSLLSQVLRVLLMQGRLQNVLGTVQKQVDFPR